MAWEPNIYSVTWDANTSRGHYANHEACGKTFGSRIVASIEAYLNDLLSGTVDALFRQWSSWFETNKAWGIYEAKSSLWSKLSSPLSTRDVLLSSKEQVSRPENSI